MRSGRAKYLVRLERRVDEGQQTPAGQVVHEFELVAEVWAEIMPGRGREFFAAAQIQATAPAEIKIRYRDDVDETCRIVHVTRHAAPQLLDYWYILAPPIPDAKTNRTDLLLMCSKGAAQGWRV